MNQKQNVVCFQIDELALETYVSFSREMGFRSKGDALRESLLEWERDGCPDALIHRRNFPANAQSGQTLSTQVSAQMMAEILSTQKETGLSRSSVLRAALQHYFAKHNHQIVFGGVR